MSAQKGQQMEAERKTHTHTHTHRHTDTQEEGKTEKKKNGEKRNIEKAIGGAEVMETPLI